MRQWLLASAILFAAVSNAAFADGSSTTLSGDWAPTNASKASLKGILHDKKFDEDERITDLELRSYAGSLNRYSLQFNLGYSGPPVNDLGDPNRPNPDSRPGDYRTALAGTMGLRYRISTDQGFNINTGVKIYAPYQAAIGQPAPKPKGRDDYDISDPGVAYDITGVVGPTQLRSQFRATYVTTTAYRQVGEFGSLGFSQYVKWTPKIMSRVILGAQLSLEYYAFNREYVQSDGNDSNYVMNVIPSFEYKLTDALNFNTSIGYPLQNFRKSTNLFRIDHQMSTWRVGIGWAITHDIYVNPYVNFFMEDPAFDTASLNLNTTFSIF